MNFYRLIKPDWAKPLLDNGKPNPKFTKEIKGPNTFEGFNLTHEYLKSKNDEGYNVYFFPNHPSKDIYSEGAKAMSGKHVDVFNFIFVDMDLKDKVYQSKEEFLDKVKQFPLKPTMVVDSGHGIHVYWAINGLTRDEYVFSNLALLKFFKTDDSVFTTCQLMRLPGYRNTKNMSEEIVAKVVEGIGDPSNIYTLSQFPQDIFQALDKTDMKRGQSHLDRLDGKLTIHAPEHVNIDEVPDTFFDFINEDRNKESFEIWMNPKGPPHNDRSRNDMKLANTLYKNNFNRKEALSVLSNTQKALEHPNRRHYAELTIDKVYAEKLNSKFLTVGQRNRTIDPEKNLGALVKTSWWIDTNVLGNPWRKRELTGLIAGPGVGKTTVTLKLIKDAIENNPENDDIYLFFSLEMTTGEIVSRWNNLVGKESPLADRLYVISNETETFEPRNIGLQEMLDDARELKKLTGKNIGMIAIDHVGIISRAIDCRKTYTFGIDSEANAGYGNINTLSANKLCDQLKPLCKMLDTHILVLTQTTKEKGAGDLPIGKDGAYGISNYENIIDRIVTIWQPLQLVQSQTKVKFMAWQYVKIRNKSPNDKIQTNEAKLMTFDLATGDIRVTTQEEYAEFTRLYPMTVEIREAQSKKKGGVGYSIQLGTDTVNKLRSPLGLVDNTGANNAVGQVQSNQHAGTN